MLDYTLSDDQMAELRQAHRQARHKRDAYRINAVILLASGWSAEQVSQALLIDADTARQYFKRYRHGGLSDLLAVAYRGSASALSKDSEATLLSQLKTHAPSSTHEVIDWVKENLRIRYSISGITAWLHRKGFSYKRPKRLPGKAEADLQDAFLEQYRNIKENKKMCDAVYFVDAAHPQHNPTIAAHWVASDQSDVIRSNTGRRRLNIQGAVDIDRLDVVVRFDKTINAHSACALFYQLMKRHSDAETIWVICDNARYYRSGIVKDFLKDTKIQLVFLPPYSPNLNLIERLWRFFKKKVTDNHYYKTFEEFSHASQQFFNRLHEHTSSLRSLLVENFQVIRQ